MKINTIKQLLLNVLVIILVIIPSVKADGCGIVCPTVEGKATFFSKIWCGFWTWALCSVVAWIIFIIIIVIGFAYWITRNNQQQGRIKLYFYVGITILLLFIFGGTIKALLFTSPFIPPPTPEIYFACDDPCIIDIRCVLSCSDSPPFFHTNATNRHTTTEEYYGLSAFPGDPSNKTVYMYPTGSVNYDIMTIWNNTGDCTIPNSTYYACYSNFGVGIADGCSGNILLGERGIITVKYVSGSGNYDLSYNCT